MQLTDRDLEGQVDHLLVSLFNDRRGFGDWFSEQLNRAGCVVPAFDTVTASRSPRRHFVRGQTDVGVDLVGRTTCSVLIENKVRHHFEADQPERYRAECDGLVANKFVDVACSVLVAPSRYMQAIGRQAEKFDACVSYEAINTFLGGNELLKKAIQRCELGWIAEAIPAVTANFERYRLLVERGYPELRLITKAGNNPTQSRTAQFDSAFAVENPPGIPYVWLLHQWQEGRAKLLFKGWGEQRGVLAPLIGKDVAAAGMSVDPNRSKSLGIMLPTPRVDNHGTFHGQVDAFIAGLDAIRQLRQWYLDNTKLVEAWAIRAGTLSGV